MKRRETCDDELPPTKYKKIGQSSNDLYDDILTSFFSFLNFKEVILNCSLVCKQWYIQCTKVPLSIKLYRRSTIPKMIKSELLSNLTYLDASKTHYLKDFVGLEEIRALSSSKYMTNLKSLILTANDISDECCQLIANSPYLKNLTCLEFGESELQVIGVEYLANSENCKNLRKLKLESIHVETLGIFKTVLNGKYFSNLTDLNIGDILPEDLEDFHRLTQLTSLTLSMNDLKNLEMVTTSPSLSNLTSLNLSFNSIEKEVRQIANSKYLKQLTLLDLSGNDIGNDGLNDIFNSPNMSNLKSLIIFDCACSISNCKSLCESKYINNLTCLNISGNEIGCEGLKMIVASPKMIHLTYLHVGDCDFNDPLEIISTAKFSPQLTAIGISLRHIQENEIVIGKFNNVAKLVFATHTNINSTMDLLIKVFPHLKRIDSLYQNFFKIENGNFMPTRTTKQYSSFKDNISNEDSSEDDSE